MSACSFAAESTTSDLQVDLTVSYIAKYDLTVDGVTYHLAGTHGPFVVSGDTGNPRHVLNGPIRSSAGPGRSRER
jgi:hypothetical protein